MMTVKQVSLLTGVSIRSLQFYDEIGLLKPTQTTAAGYRLYDDAALEKLQQILFFKELEFTLKEIKTIMSEPAFDKAAAFAKQRELLELKRDRLSAMLGLLDKLIKGEACMDFKTFDMREYYRILDDFKRTHTEAITTRLGSMERFDEMVRELQGNENEIAEMAEKQFGSLSGYTNAMEKNLAAFLENGPSVSPADAEGLSRKTDELTQRLTALQDRDENAAEVRSAVGELIEFVNACNGDMEMGENYWPFMAELYLSNPAFIQATDQKYGAGASRFIGRAIRAYLGG
ncbi:MerR family transcriptional regulator [Butyricicoccus faecihominis]|uniref:MerR family transcriptional regulator n=1 Tax=Butyricicoccus faecihominis TaxID=1712515 RepID=UPI0024799879|nr:MerR family transcriptional regulator [Butyricicoccus faecihominis]MCQ5128776.1 MerR family transcriptional regulator [Butyricicoccus faecihominis]